MNHTVTEIEPAPPKESKTIDDALRLLWDKVREASDIITELKHVRQQLQSRIESIEKELSSVHAELTSKEQEIKRLKGELAQSASSNGTIAILTEEKEILKSRIKELIATINSHL